MGMNYLFFENKGDPGTAVENFQNFETFPTGGYANLIGEGAKTHGDNKWFTIVRVLNEDGSMKIWEIVPEEDVPSEMKLNKILKGY